MTKKGRRFIPLAPGFDELSRYVACDLESLGYRTPLGNQTGEIVGGRQKETFGQFLDLNTNGQLHKPIVAPLTGRTACRTCLRYNRPHSHA